MRVSDFGMTRVADSERKTISDFGPLKWMAPEVRTRIESLTIFFYAFCFFCNTFFF